MTPNQIAELKRLCDGATPGPWINANGERGMDFAVLQGSRRGCSIVKPASMGVGAMHAKENADFIAASRQALPALIEMVERMQKVVDAAIEVKRKDDLGYSCGAEIMYLSDALAELDNGRSGV